MIARNPKSYRINLIRDLREKEFTAERRKRLHVLACIFSFGLLILALLYAGLTTWKMEMVLTAEEKKLINLQNEYKKYTATRTIVDKDDVELLHSLQGRGIFWTKKLAAMANHLPENYWITRFAYSSGELRVSGFGYISPKQDQLLILDGYMKELRDDTTFSNIFRKVYLNRADRIDDQGVSKVSFEFSAETKSAGRRR